LINPVHWTELEAGYSFPEEQALSAHVAQLLEGAKGFGLVSKLGNDYNLHLLNDAEDTELGKAFEPFGTEDPENIRNQNAKIVYRKAAERFYETIDKTAIHDVSNMPATLPEGELSKKMTRPHCMQMHAGTDPAPNWEWEYTGRFLRKMYSVCLSLQRTLGVLNILKEMIEANNARIIMEGEEDRRRQSFPQYYGVGLIDFKPELKVWVYQNDMGAEEELLAVADLKPWQQPYNYYYMQEELYKLPGELLAYWEEQYNSKKTELRDVTGRRQQAMLTELQEIQTSTMSISFKKKIEEVQPDLSLPEKIRDLYKVAVLQFGG